MSLPEGKRIAIFFANGLEECEGLITVDVLRRAQLPVDIIAVAKEREVTSSHGVHIVCDQLLEETNFEDYDMLILPGGMPGTTNLAACEPLCEQIVAFAREGKRLSAICAAPTVFSGLGLLKGKRATCFPGMQEQLVEDGASLVDNQAVVEDGIFITSQGLGTAMDFGLTIVAHYLGVDEAERIGRATVHLRTW